MLTTGGPGLAIEEGQKEVEKLTVPLFPWTEHPLRELNAKILSHVDTGITGGDTDEDEYPRAIFVPHAEVLGGVWPIKYWTPTDSLYHTTWTCRT